MMKKAYLDSKSTDCTYFSFCHPEDNGPFLGSRKPKQPYEWLSYREVRVTASSSPCKYMTSCYRAVHLNAAGDKIQFDTHQ